MSASSTEGATPVPLSAGAGASGAGARSAVPTEEEMAAILAAIEMAWPRPVVVAQTRPETGAWRFSGRWWSKPHTVQRMRPWVERS